MQNQTPAERQTVLRPLESLLLKSEKAMDKLALGTWQRAKLMDNVHALRLALALLAGDAGKESDPRNVSRADTADASTDTGDEDGDNGMRVPHTALTQAYAALDDMLRRSEKAQLHFAQGTAQHTLQRNRINALRAAQERVSLAMGELER